MKKIVIIVGIVVAVLAIIIATTPSDEEIHQKAMKVAMEEGQQKLNLSTQRLALAEARLTNAKINRKGYGDMGRGSCEQLGLAAKRINPSASWFASCDDIVSGENADTSDAQITKLSDGKYCATFTSDKESNEIQGYTFEQGRCGKGTIHITTSTE